MRRTLLFRVLLGLSLIALLVACGTPTSVIRDSAPSGRIPDSQEPIVKHEPRSKYGNPPSYEVFGKRYYTLPTAKGYKERGIASWYGTKFHGRRTSSGEPYNMYAMTAAHKTLPLPTYVEVKNLSNGRTLVLKVNDRGPFHGNRIIDLSYAAATKLGIAKKGTGLVEVRALDPATYYSEKSAPSRVNYVEQKSNPAQTHTPRTSAKVPLIFVQVGAFREIENANRLRAQLKPMGLGVVNVKSESTQDTSIHRVRIGPLDSVKHADQLVARLDDAGHKDYKLVIE